MMTATIVRRSDRYTNLSSDLSPQSCLHTNSLLDRILRMRGISDSSELNYALKDLPSPAQLPDIDIAIARLARARQENERIIIVGDYDCDGATSTVVAIEALRAMGFQDIHYLVPNRFEFGYGLSAEIVDLAAQQKPELIITVDNGVASLDGVARANQLGIDVVVTDHHLPPDSLPQAVAIVNPNLADCQFESKSLAGVGVIFYVMLALRSYLTQHDVFTNADQQPPNLANLLDLVAIGTVADVVPLDRVNRILVEQGLRRIRAGQTRPGVNALISVASRKANLLTTADIGFAVGPRLNAAGRLDDIGTGIQCLLATSRSTADALALELNSLNQERRGIESRMQREAEIMTAELIQAREADQQPLLSLCLAQPHWHQGVVGLLAGRIKEKLHIPVIAFAEDEQGMLKGSARSIPGLHIRDALHSVAMVRPGLLKKFGGHAMAAGLHLAEHDLDEFRQIFNAEIVRLLNGKAPIRQWDTDGELSTDDMTVENARLLRFVAPWGQGFPEPLFDGVFVLNSARPVKNLHTKLSLSPVGSHSTYDAIAFNQQIHSDKGTLLRLVYRLDVNSFRLPDTLQLIVLHHEVCPNSAQQSAHEDVSQNGSA